MKFTRGYGNGFEGGLTEMHNTALSTHIRTKTVQFINMIRDCCAHSIKDSTRDSEALRTIVKKTEYNNLSEVNWIKILEDTWLNPAVRLWVDILT